MVSVAGALGRKLPDRAELLGRLRAFAVRYIIRIELLALVVIIRSIERRWSEYLLLSDALAAELLRIPAFVILWASVSAIAFVVLVGVFVSAPIVGALCVLQKRRSAHHWRRAVVALAAFALPAIGAALWYEPQEVAAYQQAQLAQLAKRFGALPDAITAYTQQRGGIPPLELSELVPSHLTELPRAPFHTLRVRLLGERVEQGWTYQVLPDESGTPTGWILGVDASLEGHAASLHTPPQSGPLDSQCVVAAGWQLCRR